MRKRLFLLIIGLFCLLFIQAQVQDSTFRKTQLTPGGYFDKVHDRWGNVYTIDMLAVNDTVRADAVARENHTATHIVRTVPSLCTSTGYFSLHYDSGWCMGCDSAKQVAVQSVFCQVLSDISSFISSPLSVTGNKVNILVKSTQSLNAPGDALGGATSFYVTPGNPCSGGIADNAVWQTINSGIDAYTNVAVPLYASSRFASNGSPYYHGLAAFNFATIPWHLDLTSSPNTGEYDLYTVALHEFTHTLGFNTLIYGNGYSIIGNNYFSRYDQYLQNYDSIPLITQQYGSSCNTLFLDTPCNKMYASIFNMASIKGTGINAYGWYTPNFTVCDSAVKYVSTRDTVPVYTPSIYETGSSFSHFEDGCLSSCSTFNACHGQYFVMSNAIGTGVMKRYWKPEEMRALWDMGYQVSDSFGSATNLNGYNYGSSNTAVQVVGINDGFTNTGAYQYVTKVGGASVTINPIGNDYNCASLTCPEIVEGYGSISSITNNSFVYNPPTTLDSLQNPGVYLIRYLPVDSLGNVGNITYVFVYVENTIGCSSAPLCNNMLMNGDFENHVGCGNISGGQSSLSCWSVANGGPDVHSIACNDNCYLGGYTLGTVPAVTVNHPLTDPADTTAVFGMQTNIDKYGYSQYDWEGITQTLSTPLVPNRQYTISFWAVVHNNPNSPSLNYPSFLPTDCKDAIVSFASGAQLLAYQTTSAPLAGLTMLCRDTVKLDSATPMGWTHYVDTFTFHPVSGGSESQFYMATMLDSSLGQRNTYVFVDDIVLMPTDQTCTFDTAIRQLCVGDTIPNLGAYYNPTYPGGVFSGTGVSANGSGGYQFVPASAGQYTLTYSYTNVDSCIVKLPTPVINVQDSIGPVIIGDSVICTGNQVAVTTNYGTVGSWGSTNPALATINAGLITAIAAGLDTITFRIYDACTGDTVTAIKPIVINQSPIVSAIIGPSHLCVDSSVTFMDDSTGGVWGAINGNAAITIDSATGFATAGTIPGGGSLITYSVTTNGCTTTVTSQLTIDPSVASAIVGLGKVCVGDSIHLVDYTYSGTWSSSNPLVAIVRANGEVVGIAPGTDTISYTVTNACGTLAPVTQIITVYAYPVVAPITGGTSSVCVGSTITLVDTTTGGSWGIASAQNYASVGTTGVVTGLAAGSVLVTYTLTNAGGCSTVANYAVTIKPLPVADPIQGSNLLCIGSSRWMNDAAPGGTWSSSNTAIANILRSSGVVMAVSAGSDTITYTVINSCGTAIATKAITIVAPIRVAPIGGWYVLCAGHHEQLTDSTVGGSWSCSTPSYGTINDSTGLLTGVNGGGLDTVTYTVYNGCTASVSKAIPIFPLPTVSPITGPSVLCVGGNILLQDSILGGYWHASNGHASGDGTGEFYGYSNGLDTIEYTVSNEACSDTIQYAINVGPPIIAPIVGASSICGYGDTIHLHDATPGGTWSSINTSIATVSSSTGVVTGVSSGNVVISYTVTNACGTSRMVFNVNVINTVLTPPITGDSTVCVGGSITLSQALDSFALPHIWSSGNDGIATVGSTSGIVTGVKAGLDTITFSVPLTATCYDTARKAITVIGAPAPPDSFFVQSICLGGYAYFYDNTPGGFWSMTNSNATVAQGGSYYPYGYTTGIALGTDTINYTVSNGCGTSTVSLPFSIVAPPYVAPIIGTDTICQGSSIQWNDSTLGGTWSSNYNAIATVDSTGHVTGVGIGTININYMVNDSGCSTIATQPVTVINCNPYVPCTERLTTRISQNMINNKNSSTFTAGLYSIAGTLEIKKHKQVTLTDAEIIMESGAQIIVDDSAVLIIKGSHLYTCTDTWDGIQIRSGGAIEVTGTPTHSTLIEDALIALNYNNPSIANPLAIKSNQNGAVPNVSFPALPYVMSVDNTIFNRNGTGISIHNYDPSTPTSSIDYPFYVKNTVFTCRDIQFVSGSQQWVDVATLKNINVLNSTIFPSTPLGLASPYINESIYPSTDGAAYLKPDALTKSSYGIVLDGIATSTSGAVDYRHYIKIGNSTLETEPTDTNIESTSNVTIFDNMDTAGIYATAANLTVVNCTFQKGPDSTVSTGIFANNNATGSNNSTNRITVESENPGTLPNDAFFDLYTAIQINDYLFDTITNADVRCSRYYDTSWGIYINTDNYSNGFYSSAVIVNNNNIYDIAYPVYLNSNGNNSQFINVEANHNTIDLCTPDGTGCTGNEVVNTGIYLSSNSNNSLSSTRRHSVTPLQCDSNYINGAYNGIFISWWQYKQTIADSNTINLVTDNNPNDGYLPQYGVHVEYGEIPRAGDANQIEQNAIQGDFSLYNPTNGEAGIELVYNNQTNVTCNQVYALTYGLHFYGADNPSTCFDNIIDASNQYGLVLDNAGTAIGPQGNPYTGCTQNNQWTQLYNAWDGVNYFKTSCFGADPTLSPIYYDPSWANYDPTGFTINGLQYAVGSSLFDITSVPSACAHCTINNNPITPYVISFPVNQNALSNYAVQVAQATLPITQSDSSQRMYVLQKQLHGQLLGDTALLTSSPVLQSFVANNANTNIGKFQQVNDLLAGNNLAATATLLNSIQPANGVDVNYKKYYNWMLNKRNGLAVQPSDKADIYNLAKGCPAVDGTVVLAARNFYNYLNRSTLNFANGCGSIDHDRKAAPKKEAVTDSVSVVDNNPKEIVVYPNPTKGEVNIQLPSNGNWRIVATDIMGKTIWQEVCDGCEGTIHHNFTASKGMYFIKITNTTTGKQYVKKVSLQ